MQVTGNTYCHYIAAGAAGYVHNAYLTKGEQEKFRCQLGILVINLAQRASGTGTLNYERDIHVPSILQQEDLSLFSWTGTLCSPIVKVNRFSKDSELSTC